MARFYTPHLTLFCPFIETVTDHGCFKKTVLMGPWHTTDNENYEGVCYV